jgi:hypothetical protein
VSTPWIELDLHPDPRKLPARDLRPVEKEALHPRADEPVSHVRVETDHLSDEELRYHDANYAPRSGTTRSGLYQIDFHRLADNRRRTPHRIELRQVEERTVSRGVLQEPVETLR